jgi:hypothetical protein
MVFLLVNVTPQMSACLSASLIPLLSGRTFQQQPDSVGKPVLWGQDGDLPVLDWGDGNDWGKKEGVHRTHLAAARMEPGAEQVWTELQPRVATRTWANKSLCLHAFISSL